jgi:2-polyprenyl-3-methyl-5-hydroxy-6-metoxy-1,4-benzoquinol methylase
MKKQYNTTNLNVDRAAERGIIHRDYAAHFFRWSFVGRFIDFNSEILDVGCADAPLARILYVNKYKPKKYVGIDLRQSELDKASKFCTNFLMHFYKKDVTEPFDVGKFDVVCCFEVAEHIPPDKLPGLLENLANSLKPGGICLFSTPCYDGVHQAGNHIKEYTYDEIKHALSTIFSICGAYGTFISQKDLKQDMQPYEMQMFKDLSLYYDSNALSAIFAPMHPSKARNCLWVLRK